MLLRSSSTPVLGSLLPSFSESPSNHQHHHSSDPHTTIKHPPIPPTIHQNHTKLSFHQSGSPYYPPILYNSSSIADLSSGTQHSNGFRRVQSEGNLEGLTGDALRIADDGFGIPNPPKNRRKSCSHLETIPSFSFHNARYRYEDELDSDEEEEGEELEETDGGWFENSNRALNLQQQQNMALDEELRLLFKEHSTPEMYLAKGLGVDSLNIGFGGGGEHNNGRAGGSGGGGGGGGGSYGGDDGGGNLGIEEHYKRLLEENPGNPLCLRNYAQFLYESKGDLKRAEEYYSRAILADSKDGEVLSQYAKLVWELHHDQDRALSYFERAAQAAPEDSHVHAAYASFLWETEEHEDRDDHHCVLPMQFQNGAMTSATA